MDLVYGISAAIVLIVGLLRVFNFEKGAPFYAQNLFFWIKMAGFALVALLSIYPTIRFLLVDTISSLKIEVPEISDRDFNAHQADPAAGAGRHRGYPSFCGTDGTRRWDAVKMNDEQRTQLNEQGYLIFKSLLSREQVEALLARLEELWAAEGEKAGEENYIEPGVRRLANLASKGSLFREVYAHPQVLEVVEAVMGLRYARQHGQRPRCAAAHGRADAFPYGFRQGTASR